MKEGKSVNVNELRMMHLLGFEIQGEAHAKGDLIKKSSLAKVGTCQGFVSAPDFRRPSTFLMTKLSFQNFLFFNFRNPISSGKCVGRQSVLFFPVFGTDRRAHFCTVGK